METTDFQFILTASVLVGFGLSALFGVFGAFIRGLLTTVFDYRP